MAMPLAYSFDYRGINDATSKFRERIATFSTSIPSEDIARHGHLWVAAPDMLAALKAARPHIGVGYSGIQRYAIMTAVDAAIAKAEGR